LRAQIDQLQAFQNQSVTWVFSGDTVDAEEEIQALHSTGLDNIRILAPTDVNLIELGEPDLVILSYDGTDEGRNRLGKIATILKELSPPVFLLIYTYRRTAPAIRIEQAETTKLGDFRWYQPVNFPTSLITQTQLLIRKRRIAR
jgi:hypothetical protein